MNMNSCMSFLRRIFRFHYVGKIACGCKIAAIRDVQLTNGQLKIDKIQLSESIYSIQSESHVHNGVAITVVEVRAKRTAATNF